MSQRARIPAHCTVRHRSVALIAPILGDAAQVTAEAAAEATARACDYPMMNAATYQSWDLRLAD